MLLVSSVLDAREKGVLASRRPLLLMTDEGRPMGGRHRGTL